MVTAPMDLITIPPELFYSSNSLKARCLSKITPAQITKSQKKVKPSKSNKKSPTRFKIGSNGPQLGKIGKSKIRMTKLIQKYKKRQRKALTDKSNTSNRTDHSSPEAAKRTAIEKPMTKVEEKQIRKEISMKEDEIKRNLYKIDENAVKQQKRAKGSNFKFFKSKNSRDEDSSSDESEDLVPEIRDYSKDDSFFAPPAPKATKVILDPIDSDEPEPNLDDTVNAIESLLQDLEKTPHKIDTLSAPKTPELVETLDSLIGTLEGSDQPRTKSQKAKFLGFGENQLQIDAGQKKFGIVECKDCGFSYNTNVPEDEKLHNKHHHAMTSIPKFRGWTNEDSISISQWTSHNGRIIHLAPGHKHAKSEIVAEIIGKMELEFGWEDNIKRFHMYLAIYESKIAGIALIEDSVEGEKDNATKCVKIGVHRLFVRPEFRRKGIASALLKTIVIMHEKGELLSLNSDVAFNNPTMNGQRLINKVVGGSDFYVYFSSDK